MSGIITDPAALAAFSQGRGGFRADANTKFMARDLEYIESEVMAHQYAPLDGFTLCPVNTSVAEHYKTVTVRSSNSGGKPVFAQDGSSQIPNIDGDLTEDTWNMRRMLIGSVWSDLELAAARHAGRPLDPSGSIACVKALFTMIDNNIFDGALSYGLRGFFDTATVPRVKSAVGFNSSSTPLDILNALNDLANSVADETNSAISANRLALSSREYDYCKNTPMSADNPMNILDQFVANSSFITNLSQIFRIPRLRSVTAGGVDLGAVAVAFNFDPDYIQVAVVNPKPTGAPQFNGVEYLQIWSASMSEVQWRAPKSAKILWAIDRT